MYCNCIIISFLAAWSVQDQTIIFGDVLFVYIFPAYVGGCPGNFLPYNVMYTSKEFIGFRLKSLSVMGEGKKQKPGTLCILHAFWLCTCSAWFDLQCTWRALARTHFLRDCSFKQERCSLVRTTRERLTSWVTRSCKYSPAEPAQPVLVCHIISTSRLENVWFPCYISLL